MSRCLPSVLFDSAQDPTMQILPFPWIWRHAHWHLRANVAVHHSEIALGRSGNEGGRDGALEAV